MSYYNNGNAIGLEALRRITIIERQVANLTGIEIPAVRTVGTAPVTLQQPAGGTVVLSAGTVVVSNQGTTTVPGVLVAGSIYAEPWIAGTLIGTWSNFGAGFNNAGFYKDQTGRVYLRGLVRFGTVGSNIFLLPPGYRPTGRELHAVNSNGAIGRIDITTSGEVIALTGSNEFFSLDGITFRV